MTYLEWCNEVASIVRKSRADTIITADAIMSGPVNYLDEPRRDFDDGVTPDQAAGEIVRRIGTLNRA